jgi:hypothetical protein
MWMGAALALSLTLISGLKAQALTDPTRPPSLRAESAAAAQTVPGRMRVEAILNRGTDCIAIVDGEVVRVGDHIGNARIEEIMHDGVRYTRAGVMQFARIETIRLQVRRESVTQVAQKDTP